MFYTVKEISEKLKIETLTLTSMIRNKLIGAVKVRGQWRISEEQFNDFIQKNTS